LMAFVTVWAEIMPGKADRGGGGRLEEVATIGREQFFARCRGPITNPKSLIL
jgi:hypothetical protein